MWVFLLFIWSVRVGLFGMIFMDSILELGFIFWLVNCCFGGIGFNSFIDELGLRIILVLLNNLESFFLV